MAPVVIVLIIGLLHLCIGLYVGYFGPRSISSPKLPMLFFPFAILILTIYTQNTYWFTATVLDIEAVFTSAVAGYGCGRLLRRLHGPTPFILDAREYASFSNWEEARTFLKKALVLDQSELGRAELLAMIASTYWNERASRRAHATLQEAIQILGSMAAGEGGGRRLELQEFLDQLDEKLRGGPTD
jgi:hypothetical protein